MRILPAIAGVVAAGWALWPRRYPDITEQAEQCARAKTLARRRPCVPATGRRDPGGVVYANPGETCAKARSRASNQGRLAMFQGQARTWLRGTFPGIPRPVGGYVSAPGIYTGPWFEWVGARPPEDTEAIIMQLPWHRVWEAERELIKALRTTMIREVRTLPPRRLAPGFAGRAFVTLEDWLVTMNVFDRTELDRWRDGVRPPMKAPSYLVRQWPR